MSKDWEHTVANGIHEHTADDIRAYRCGYSGSSKFPQPDVLVTKPSENAALELKGPIKSDRCYVEEEDVQQLHDCANANTISYLVIKFHNREPLVIRYYKRAPDAGYKKASVAERLVMLTPEEFDPRVTNIGNFAVSKPSLADWNSTQAGRGNIETILDGIAVAGQHTTVL